MQEIIERGEKVFSHVLSVEVLMTDLTTRNVEIKFNGWDNWEDTNSCPLETGNMLYRALIKVFDKDINTLGWKGTLLHLDSTRQPIRFAPYAKRQLQ